MEMNREDFGPEALGGFGDSPSRASIPDRDEEVPPDVEVIEPESYADAKRWGAASYTSRTRMGGGAASITETVVERQGVRERTRVSVIRFCRLEITSEHSEHWLRS